MKNSTTSIAFLYPDGTGHRKHGPAGYDDVQSFRPWLRDEFSFRCVYCLKREAWESPIGGFDIDHVVPRSSDRSQILQYENLVYSCHGCNLRRSNHPIPSPETYLTSMTAYVALDGYLVGLNDGASEIVERLMLNSPAMIEYRLQWIRIVELAAEHDFDFLRRVMGYPADVPDLRLSQPPINGRPAGIEQCIFVLRETGQLRSEIHLQ